MDHHHEDTRNSDFTQWLGTNNLLPYQVSTGTIICITCDVCVRGKQCIKCNMYSFMIHAGNTSFQDALIAEGYDTQLSLTLMSIAEIDELSEGQRHTIE